MRGTHSSVVLASEVESLDQASRLSAKGQAWVNLSGHCLFLMPVATCLFVLSLPYVTASWQVLEGSPEVGGIPGVFLLKSLIPVASVLLLLQGLLGTGQAIRTIRSRDDSARRSGGQG